MGNSQLAIDFGKTSIARHYVIIAKDQRNLLDRNESWASLLRRRPHGYMNVPPEVLENLKEAYIRQLQPTQSDKSPTSTDTSENGDCEDEAGDKQPPQDLQSRFGDQDEDGVNSDDDSDCSRQTYWSPSPEDHFRARREVEGVELEEPFATQISEKSPPQPTAQPLPKRSTFNDFPSSSLEQEDELELEVPTALDNSALASDKSAQQISATPPSAQVVPCTFELPKPSPKPKTRANPRQPIYKPPPPLYRPPKTASISMNLGTGPDPAKIGPTKPPFAEAQSSVSTSNTSSSIIPSTNQNVVNHNHLPAWMNQSVPSPTLGPQTSPATVEGTGSLYVQPHSPQPRSVPPLPPTLQPAPPPRVHQVIPLEAPFIRYTIAYPGYTGSIGDFITSCMYIQLQQRRLRTCLYDDFIRAWSEGYLPYVRNCDDSEPPVKAMNAIEWYNSIDDDPLFTSRVVTRQNLEATLNFYPDELQTARSLLGVSPNRSQQPSHSPDIILPDNEPATLLEPVAPPVERRAEKTLTKTSGLPTRAPRADPVVPPAQLPVPASPRREPNPTISLSQSVDEVDKGPVRSKGPSRSFSEVVPNKRKANNELGGDVPKRMSTSFMARSDSGSTASFHSKISNGAVQPSSTPSATLERKKKHTNDPEKRSRQFAKFLKRRKWEQESIASSAPISNTPTSGKMK
ncbi:hypothetical protein F5X99DRAFT_421828 [Biscogniauxia marginata]|nr:hypothetical protein F5X99DRAFT_421828 [Biscogniauxia marginata]